MSITYYIDGYNVMHQWDEFRKPPPMDFETARDAFIALVSRFCTTAGCRAIIVFDGRGRHLHRTEPEHFPGGVDVLYAPGHSSADTVIERSVYLQPSRKFDLVVVSGDRGIRDLCVALVALAMGPRNFLDTMRESLNNASRNLTQTAQRHTRTVLEERLDTNSLNCLRAWRRRLEK